MCILAWILLYVVTVAVILAFFAGAARGNWVRTDD